MARPAAAAGTGTHGMDTVEQRWSRLEPHVQAYGPADDLARPAVLLFHGCGGVRDLAKAYGEAAAAAGFRAFSIDSYAARGWPRTYGLAFVCTGLAFHGSERAGDVLAATWGISRRKDVDASKMALAGWSHGSWSIMDLMTMPLKGAGEAGLADPDPACLEGVRGVFLAYPYGGLGALSRIKPWVRTPEVLGVIAKQDHVTSVRDAERLYATAQRAGSSVDLWRVDATHAFDENGTGGIMRYDEALSKQARERFVGFLKKTLAVTDTRAAAGAA